MKLLKHFYEKELQKKKEVKKIFERKGDKYIFKLKDFDNSFNNWIDKKDGVNE